MLKDKTDEHGLPLWPAAERNKEVILQELLPLLRERSGVLLEIASATGQHAVHFAPSLPQFEYQLSDYDDEHLATLTLRQKRAGLSNLRPPLRLDASSESWPLEKADVIYNANMVHIAPYSVAEGLFRGAGRLLSSGGLLITYGPYKIDGKHTSESNAKFDESLRSRDPSWGVRDLSELGAEAQKYGFASRSPLSMPANNFLVVWDKD